ncbi:hypothetical protein Lser_V15G04910 [Lactuca serriola]
MSKMMRSDRKPPLALRSPVRLRPRRPLQSTANNLQTPSGFSTKSRVPKQSIKTEESELRPEYHTISSELKALTKMVQENLRGSTDTNQVSNAAYHESPLFERGKLYEEYSARRNERLKRKRGESEVEKNTPCKQYLGVRNESAKKTEVKKFESSRKMTTPLVDKKEVGSTMKKEVGSTMRYSLRSNCKENKKPPLGMSFDRSMEGTVEKKTITVRRTARKGY